MIINTHLRTCQCHFANMKTSEIKTWKNEINSRALIWRNAVVMYLFTLSRDFYLSLYLLERCKSLDPQDCVQAQVLKTH